MVELDVQRTEMTYTAFARIEAASGEPRRALDVVKRLIDERLTPKLRTFAPALHAFCMKGDIEGALEAEAEIANAGIEISEAEYGALLVAYADAERWEDGLALLRRMREEIRTLSAPLVESTRRFFDAHPGWRVEESAVDEASGAASSAPTGKRMQLAAINLSASDRAALLAGIGKLAREREAKSSFDGFVRWLARRGPLPYLVDGANVGMYNQNFQESRFNFNQVEKAMNALRPLARDTHAARRDACGEPAPAPAPSTATEPKRAGDSPPGDSPPGDSPPGDGNGGDDAAGAPAAAEDLGLDRRRRHRRRRARLPPRRRRPRQLSPRSKGPRRPRQPSESQGASRRVEAMRRALRVPRGVERRLVLALRRGGERGRRVLGEQRRDAGSRVSDVTRAEAVREVERAAPGEVSHERRDGFGVLSPAALHGLRAGGTRRGLVAVSWGRRGVDVRGEEVMTK